MTLPPFPIQPRYSAEDMLAYGEECIRSYRKHKAGHLGVSRCTPKFDAAQADDIRALHARGMTYKQTCRKYDMSEATFYKIVHRRGAYA